MFPEPLAESALKAAQTWMTQGPSVKASAILGLTRMPTPDRMVCKVINGSTLTIANVNFL